MTSLDKISDEDLEKLADLHECQNCNRYVTNDDIRYYYARAEEKGGYYCIPCVDMLIEIAHFKEKINNYQHKDRLETDNWGLVEFKEQDEEGNIHSKNK